MIENARHVRLDPGKVREVAGWMAFEGLPWPDFRSPMVPEGNDRDTMDFIFLGSTINFAFTDFNSHVTFRTSFAGRELSDSDAMFACLRRAYDGGVPILEGSYLSRVGREEVEQIFSGNIPIPMLEARLSIFHQVGRRLGERHQGRFHRFATAGPPRLYSQGEGLLKRLLGEFPSFQDSSTYQGHRILFQKRAQLLWWLLHARFRQSGFFRLEDPQELTVFADYIVPLALRLLGIHVYSSDLEAAIAARQLIPAGSEEEIEIRAFTLWGCHLLTQEINKLRPPELQVIEPVVDARLWTHFHTSHWPHHLTLTTAY
ncbi:MAG: queuosine salvage family protein [Acidobacteriota bacterium]